jgi:hypothetical protein
MLLNVVALKAAAGSFQLIMSIMATNGYCSRFIGGNSPIIVFDACCIWLLLCFIGYE